MSPEQEDVDDAIAAAARNTDAADARHAAPQRAYLLAVASIGDDLGGGVGATVWTDCSNGSIRLSVEHDDPDRHASLGMTLSAEAAEGLALDLLDLAQEQREAREQSNRRPSSREKTEEEHVRRHSLRMVTAMQEPH